MFGREYSKNPEILLSSFRQMNHSYVKVSKKKNNSILQRMYLALFGIPEIGFQIRSLYFNAIVEKHVGKKKLFKILDAGSGIGTYALWLAKKYPKAHVTGGEIDQEKITFSKEFSDARNITNVEFKKFDITTDVTGKEKFDLIVNIDVLEHIEDYKRVLRNFSKLLTSGGFLYIHTPQPNQKRIFKQFKAWSHEDHVHEGYTPDDLTQELKKLGFKITEKKETFGFAGKLAWELNHMGFKKGFVVTGLTYPLLYLIGLLDLSFNNKKGLGTAILARKI